MRLPPLVVALLAAPLAGFPALVPDASAQPKVAVHVAERSRGNDCAGVTSLPCGDYDTSGDLFTSYDVYVVGAGGSLAQGLAAIEFGVDYDAPLGVFGSTLCADLQFPSGTWPASGSGIVASFSPSDNCQQNYDGAGGAQAVFLSLYLYAYGDGGFRIGPRPATGQLALANCSSAEMPVAASEAGSARFSAGGVLAGVNPCAAEQIPPTLVSASGSDGGVEVLVTFDEPVPNAGDPSFYEVFETAGGSPIPVTGALLAGPEAVRLLLASPLVGGTSYTVRVTGVEDAAGNPILPGSTVEFTPPPDLVPPELVFASGSANSRFVDVDFSEPVSGAEVAANYEVFEASTGTPIGVADAALLADDSARLALDAPLAPGTTYTVRVNGITDLAGNPIATDSSFQFTTQIPPTLVSASGAAGAPYVFVTFSEPVTGSGDAANYRVFETVSGSPLAVNAATALDADDARLTLAEPLAAGTSYTVRVNGVRDLGGNPIAPDSEVEFSTGPDTSPPLLDSASGVTGDSEILVLFSEPVANGTDPGRYEVFETVSTAGLAVSSVIATSGSAYRLQVASALAAGVSYTVRVNGITDLAGNAIAPNSTAEFTTVLDATPPGIVSAAGTVGGTGVTVVFSEDLDPVTATDPANYSLSGGTPGSPPYVVQAATLPLPSRVVLTLDRGLEGGQHVLGVSGVEDLAGNAIDPTAHVTFFVAPTEPGDLRNPVIATHLGAPVGKGDPCAVTLPECHEFAVRGELLTGYTLYLVLIDLEESGSGFAGVELGIVYESTLAAGPWTYCSDLEFATPDWPASGSGNVLTWDPAGNCQRTVGPEGVRALAGALYVYAYGDARFQIVERPASGRLAVADCSSASMDLTTFRVGAPGFGNWQGYTPCYGGPAPVKETTWGGLKKLYRESDEASDRP